ncbi:hypothetical protein VIGAN_03264000, partial [Vigna angularis var. angularis]
LCQANILLASILFAVALDHTRKKPTLLPFFFPKHTTEWNLLEPSLMENGIAFAECLALRIMSMISPRNFLFCLVGEMN